MKILIDVDNIIGNLCDAVLSVYNEDSGDNLCSENITSYYIENFVKPQYKDNFKGAKAVNSAIWYFLNNATKEDIRKLVNKLYELPPVEKINFNETCQGTIPICFLILLESNSFEEAMRKAVWVGGDTDTICAIVGSMAEPLFGIPEEIEEKMWGYLDEDMKNIIRDFEWRTR